jgi:hypothetical protein
MYAIIDNDIVKVDCKEIIKLGVVEDLRVPQMEKLIAKIYNTTVYNLDIFYKDTPAKLMLCFMLHNEFNYSIKSLAERYRVYPAYLQKKIYEHYHKCLIDEAFFDCVKQLRSAFFSEDKTLQPV